MLNQADEVTEGKRSMAVSTSLKYFHEFSATNRPEGDIVLFQVAFKRQFAKYGALFY